jgi:hypothetical protein
LFRRPRLNRWTPLDGTFNSGESALIVFLFKKAFSLLKKAFSLL